MWRAGAGMSFLRGQYLAIVGLALALAGCGGNSDSGPWHRNVEAEASVTLQATDPIFNYALVDLNKNVLPYVSSPDIGSLFRTFGTGRGPPPEIKVGVGDTIQVSLFEAQAGGLFVPSDAGSRPGNFITLPSQTVDSRGYITVPYAGQILALNRSTPAIQAEIVAKLKDRAIEPQALVAIVNQVSTQVTVVGQVGSSNKISINPGGDTVIDAISRSGGIKDPGYESFVTLVRHGAKGTVYFPNLVKHAKENIFVSPGDTLYVYQYQRAFMAFGATGTSGQYKFLQEDLNLNDAVGKAGGLLDARADPRQVFVYRLEDREALKEMGADLSKFPSDRALIPTIYRVNFRDPSGFFAATKFPMRDADILYVDNADSVEITKFLTMITTIASPVSIALSDYYLIKTVGTVGNTGNVVQ
jgi:polysaccharide biosynthesis/export protein